MTDLIASIFPHAIAVALSPMPIAALILLLLSNRAKANSLAFLFGWVVAIFINVGIVIILFSAQPTGESTKSTITAVISGLLGFALLFLAFKEWKMRPKPGESPQTPKWMSAIETFSPLKAFLVAFMLVTINSKNTIIDIATGVSIAHKATSFSEGLTALIVFTVIASITIAIPVFAFLLYGDKLSDTLNRLKIWFIYNSATILFVLFLILGADLISKAFGG